MDIFEFERATLRLKELVKVKTDKDVAALLGLDESAFNKRKTRASFPKRQLLALAEARPDLAIDTHYVLTGVKTKAAAAAAVKNIPAAVRAVRGATGEAEFAAAWGIGAEQLAQIESGQRLPSSDLLMRLAELYPDDANYLLTGARPEPLGPLTGSEMVLVANYRAASEEGQSALRALAAHLGKAGANEPR